MKIGKINKSRREANFIKSMNFKTRDDYIKRFIAACNPEELIPFIKITKHDVNYREIEYVIELPEVNS